MFSLTCAVSRALKKRLLSGRVPLGKEPRLRRCEVKVARSKKLADNKRNTDRAEALPQKGSSAMAKGYANIACSIGKGLSDRLRHTTYEPLPERLTDLLSRLSESENESPRVNKEAPRGSPSRKGLVELP